MYVRVRQEDVVHCCGKHYMPTTHFNMASHDLDQ